MMNNLPVDPAMIALIELTAASDESMQKSLDIYSDNCSKKTSNNNFNWMIIIKTLYTVNKGTDECETAAQVFRCQVENDGTVVNDMVAKRAETSAVATKVHIYKFSN
jgi:hypothetical protein